MCSLFLSAVQKCRFVKVQLIDKNTITENMQKDVITLLEKICVKSIGATKVNF